MTIRYYLRPIKHLFRKLKDKELSDDQKFVVQQLSHVLGRPKWEIEATIFEVGIVTIVGVALGKLPDSLDLKKDDEMWQLVQAAGKGFRAGAKK